METVLLPPIGGSAGGKKSQDSSSSDGSFSVTSANRSGRASLAEGDSSSEAKYD